jgi:tetratricopeptide (TPR) repeat protein
MTSHSDMTESQDERLGLPSASSWRRYELCAGSWQLESEARRLTQLAHETSPAAERGRLIHGYLAGEIDENGDQIKLDESEQQTASFLQERATEQVHRIFGDEPTLELAEKRLWLTVNGRKAASGQFDRVVYTPSVALVQDFKTGWREPDPAEQNAQMKLLAVLVALNLPSMLREVVVQIISGPFGVSESRYSLPDLAKAYNEILATLRAIQDPMAPLNPSPESCRWCPAAAICQPCRDLLSPPTKFQVATLPEDPDRAAKLLDEIAILEGAFEQIKKHYSQRLENDPTYRITNYAMIPGVIRREVVDWEAARQRLGEWLELDEINGAANYRLGDLEKALGKKLKLKGKDLKERMNAILQGLVEERPNAASLKRVKGEPKLIVLNLP